MHLCCIYFDPKIGTFSHDCMVDKILLIFMWIFHYMQKFVMNHLIYLFFRYKNFFDFETSFFEWFCALMVFRVFLWFFSYFCTENQIFCGILLVAVNNRFKCIFNLIHLFSKFWLICIFLSEKFWKSRFFPANRWIEFSWIGVVYNVGFSCKCVYTQMKSKIFLGCV